MPLHEFVSLVSISRLCHQQAFHVQCSPDGVGLDAELAVGICRVLGAPLKVKRPRGVFFIGQGSYCE